MGKYRGNPFGCPDVDETICSALLVVNCLYGGGWGVGMREG